MAAVLASQLMRDRDPSRRVLVGLAGVPGAGKSTLAGALCQALREGGASVTVFPMDGFHYTRAQLDQMDDPAEMHRRRGAHFTFDGAPLHPFFSSSIADCMFHTSACRSFISLMDGLLGWAFDPGVCVWLQRRALPTSCSA